MPAVKDATTTVAEMRDRVRRFIAEREWEPFHHPKDLAISLSLEAAELLEHFQWEEKRPIEAIRKDAELIPQLSDELADVLHYLLTFANVLEIDVAHALERKMKKNAEKYPVTNGRGAMKYRPRLRDREPLADEEL